MATKTRRLADLLANIDDNSKVTSAGLLDATITAADLADDSVGVAELIDDAVTNAAVADGAIDTAAKLGSNVVTTAKILDSNITTAKIASSAVTSVKMAIDTIEVKPHIKPGMLYPALKDTGGAVRQTDGVTAVVASTVGPAGSAITSSLYGTVQSDGKMYYYTDIKGSKPIKDPRIGAYFGGQRHMFKSRQLLEQETATHGDDVYSIDGREWLRIVNPASLYQNDSNGGVMYLSATTSAFVEVIGYFNAFNLINRTQDTVRALKIEVDGVTAHSAFNPNGSVNSPLGGRFVSAGSVSNIDLTSSSSLSSNTTLGIHTLRLSWVSSNTYLTGCELIAQDTTTTSGTQAAQTVPKIQIQPQNVVSYGKRFAVGITQSATATDKKALHYNPFAIKTDGTTDWASGAHNGTGWPAGLNSAHNIDTATSLGLDKWLHSSNYYKPYNGGRVVVWVDSSGNIKTSVTVMPPNARSIKNATITPKANASVANDTYLPTFEAGVATAFESAALSEVAKTYNWREFGNGAANQGNNTSGTLQDASMLNAADDIAYVMDDGLTSLSGLSVASAATASPPGIRPSAPNKSIYITFIGSGIGGVRYRDNSAVEDRQIWAQNLPYGTHILKLERDGSNYQRITVDGVLLETNSTTALYLVFGEQFIYQPKMPPIPEDAVVIADYMLMADFVTSTVGSAVTISKGVRQVCGSRDHFYDSGAGVTSQFSQTISLQPVPFIAQFYNTNASTRVKLPFFGTNSEEFGYGTSSDIRQVSQLNGSASGNVVAAYGTNYSQITHDGATLGSNFIQVIANTSNSNKFNYYGSRVVTPIHTSHHYQPFETPFLKEIVGGDRNMEQTNLVVTPDGKTWDEVTRDVSYIGNIVLKTHITSADSTSSPIIYDEWRGTSGLTNHLHNKYFAIAYDRMICLKDGHYRIRFHHLMGLNAVNTDQTIAINGTNDYNIRMYTYNPADVSNPETLQGGFDVILQRGDYVQHTQGQQVYGASVGWGHFTIIRLN